MRNKTRKSVISAFAASQDHGLRSHYALSTEMIGNLDLITVNPCYKECFLQAACSLHGETPYHRLGLAQEIARASVNPYR